MWLAEYRTVGRIPGNLGFTAEHVTAAALRLLGRKAEADKEYTG